MLIDNMVLEFLRFPANATFVVNDSYASHSKRLSEQYRFLVPPDTDTTRTKEETHTTGLLSSLPHHLSVDIAQLKLVEGRERKGIAFSLGLAQPNSKRLLLKLKAALEPQPFTQGSTAHIPEIRNTSQWLHKIGKVASREPRLLLEPVFYEGTVQADKYKRTALARLSTRPIDGDCIEEASKRMGLVPQEIHSLAQPRPYMLLARKLFPCNKHGFGHGCQRLHTPVFPPSPACGDLSLPHVSILRLLSEAGISTMPEGDDEQQGSPFGAGDDAVNCFTFMMPKFCPEVQHTEGLRYRSALQHIMVSSTPVSKSSRTLESPVMPPPAAQCSDAQDANSTEMLLICQPANEPEFITASQLAQLTFCDIIAQDMVLDDAFQCMPPVIIADEVPAFHGSVREDISQILASLRLKSQCLASLDLHLERSLIDAYAVAHPRGTDAALLLQDGLRPQIRSQPPASTSPTQTLNLLIGRQQQLLKNKKKVTVPKQLPGIQSKLAEECVEYVRAPARARPEGARVDKRTRTPQLPISQDDASEQLKKRQAVSKTAAATDMSFFVGLQGNPNPGTGKSPQPTDVKQAAGMTTTQDLAEEEMDIRSVSLPTRHTQLLADLKADHQCLLSTIHEFSNQHTDFLSPAAVTDAVSQVTSLRKEARANSNPAYVQALAAAAVLRQTGICLVHYGIRCAQVYLQHSVLQSKTLAGLCARSVWSLSQALEDVESGSLEDHLKEAVLLSILRQMHDLNPEGKTLLLGDLCAFLPIYRVVSSAGLRAYQLDRHRALLSGKADAESVHQAVQTAISAADCILATYQHASQPGFPFNHFCTVVEYAPEAAREFFNPAALAQLSDVRRVTLTMSVNAHPPHQQSLEKQHEGQAAGDMHCFDGAAEAVSGLAADRQPAEEPSAGKCVAAITVQQSPWSVVVSTGSAILSHRKLYEAILLLERENAVIIERELLTVDLALSASTAMCLWTWQEADEERLLQEHLPAQLLQISCAYSKCVVCFEGDSSSRARLQRCLPLVHAVARSAGITVQCLTSTSAAHTQEAVLTAIKAVSQASKTVLSERPSAQQAFLERFTTWNPFTATAVAEAVALPRLLASSTDDLKQLLASIPGVTERSIDLFIAQIHSGTPVSAFLGNGHFSNAQSPDPEAQSAVSDGEVYTGGRGYELAQEPGPCNDPWVGVHNHHAACQMAARCPIAQPSYNHLQQEEPIRCANKGAEYAQTSASRLDGHPGVAYPQPSAHGFDRHPGFAYAQPSAPRLDGRAAVAYGQPPPGGLDGYQTHSVHEPFQSPPGPRGQPPSLRTDQAFFQFGSGYQQPQESCPLPFYDGESVHQHQYQFPHHAPNSVPDNQTYRGPNTQTFRPRTAAYKEWGSTPAMADQPAQTYCGYGNQTAPQRGNFASHPRFTRQNPHVAHEHEQQAAWKDLHDASATKFAAQHDSRHLQPQGLTADERAARASLEHRAYSPFENINLDQPWEDTDGQGPGSICRPSLLGVGSAEDQLWEQAGAGKLQEPMELPGCWPRPPSTNRSYHKAGHLRREPAAPTSSNMHRMWQDHGDPAGRFPVRQPGPSPRNLFATQFTAAGAEGSYEPNMEGWLEEEPGSRASLSQDLEEDYRQIPTAVRSSVPPERQETPEQTPEGWDPANVLNRWLAKRNAGAHAPKWSGRKLQMPRSHNAHAPQHGIITSQRGRSRKRVMTGGADDWTTPVKRTRTGLYAFP